MLNGALKRSDERGKRGGGGKPSPMLRELRAALAECVALEGGMRS
jgi:hypothetical protein